MEPENTTPQNPQATPERIIPSAAGDIHVPGKSPKIPFNLSIDFSPGNPVQFDTAGYGVSTTESGVKPEKPGFFKTAAAEAYEFNATAQLLHAGYEAVEKPNAYDDSAPEGWNPQTQPEMFYDIKPQYLDYLNGARGPKDLQYRHDRVRSEQEHDETLENGSMFAKLMGGLGGAVLDPINLIPIAGVVKYAKMAPTILKGIQRALPGAAAYGVIQSGAKQLDSVNGNLHDFVVDSFINTAFGAALFGGAPAAALMLDKMELWKLRDLAKSSMEGVDFKFELGEKNEVVGIKAFDETGTVGAAKVTQAQEIANSAFLKGGLFKIPYVGEGILALKGAPIIGSPLVAMMNSKSAIERAFIDRAADHSFWRAGVEKGEASPKSFEHLMKREFADLRGMAAQLNALHLERMGFDINPPKVGDVRYAAQAVYSKSLKMIAKDSEKYGYVSREHFDDEVQKALTTGELSEHAAVNSAYSIIRPKLDNLIKEYNNAYGKSQTMLTPKMAAEFLMRVYDTDYMNANKHGVNGFVPIIANYFKEGDELIAERMQPIHDLDKQIKDFESAHTEAVHELGRRESELPEGTELVPFSTQVGHPIRTYHVKGRERLTSSQKKLEQEKQTRIANQHVVTLASMRRQLKSMKETLQNELRNNPDLRYHVHDWFALSADEAKELSSILSPRNKIQKDIDAQKSIISDLKEKRSRQLSATKNTKTKEKAKPKAEKFVDFDEEVKKQEDKLHELNLNHQDEEYELYLMAKEGTVNPQFYYPETLKFKDPNERLRFRDTYENHEARTTHASAAYDSIMHTNPEDTIADIMGKATGNSKENHLKARTLMVPDTLLYENNFMTKNLMSKVNNYALYVSRRTHVKNVFKDVTIEGGIEPIIEKRHQEYQSIRAPLDNRKSEIAEEIKSLHPTDDAKKIESLHAEEKKIDKNLLKEKKEFNRSKERMNNAYERMMGLRKREKWEVATQGIVRSLSAIANLHQIGLTQVADVGAIGLQHGAWPFIRDAVYPVLTSINGLLKTKDSEAIRDALGDINLGLQDVLNGHADKAISLETQPYVNMGPIVSGIEKLAHFSSNADLTTYFENWLQRWSASVIQSKLMKNIHSFVKGTASKKDIDYLLHYGIDPKQWGERMVKSFEDAKGFKTKLGGYSSRFWQWQDMEAANEFSSAVFRGVQNTIINRGMFDSPYWHDNLMGMIFQSFTGWGFASVNRYLIPMLQRPDAEQLLGVILSLGLGSMVSPLRRMERGEDYYPDNMTDGQKFYETIADSNVSSALTNVLSWANYLSQDKLIGELKNDKYRNRVGVGASSVVFGTANKMYNILDSLASGEANTKDLRDAAHMLPISGSLYGRKISDLILEHLSLPANRRAAHTE